MNPTRDLAAEAADNAERKYAYDFDGAMHVYMMRTFGPLLPRGKCLELGCYEGAFTRHLVPLYPDLTVVEAVGSLIETTRAKVPPTVRFVEGMLETVDLPADAFDAIFLIHVLEHVDDAAFVLSRVNRWLSPRGRLFLACPNANAASRQIAVKMGLIPHNTAITPGEAAQGHRRTYTLDLFERHAREAKLKVVRRGGVFFKPLANFQFDQLAGGGVVSKDYLEGCYLLGEHYPDMCASIYLVCEKG